MEGYKCITVLHSLLPSERSCLEVHKVSDDIKKKTPWAECEASHALFSSCHRLQIVDLKEPPLKVQLDGNPKVQGLDCMLDC
jgi:hypothetical protein